MAVAAGSPLKAVAAAVGRGFRLGPAADMSWHTPWAAMRRERMRRGREPTQASSSAPAQPAYGFGFELPSVNDLIGTHEHDLRNFKTQLFCSFSIYHKLKRCRLLHRQIARLFTL
jgi:hypothetical protein